MKYLPKKIEIKFTQDKTMKAIVNLVFEDFIIKGFRILVSDFENPKGDKFWIVPPSYKGSSGYHPIFFMSDKKKWEKLSGLIWDEYYKQINT
jgi:hypothetical protein